MKKNITIIVFLVFGLLIGWFLPDLFTTNDSKITSENAEKIVELMGNETSFGVKGNCGMCKKTIETAALSLSGVTNADWDKQTKQIKLIYDPQIVDLMSIHQAIANSGYGTELVENNMDSYDNLPLCCKYDPKMNIKSN
ncbi:MAG: heavy metal transporter [Flavobacteriaceae bacterium]|jgi:copper chaperone CopZ|nr:heavy metal transporter [Flavobacteriaceae bacterium]RCL66155.1 MAG: copper chaperone [Cryomorphaceae bacterium]|tara:strand:- start:625 stop:1041 length:417 start_codon:yes stop_codon:yes gene_type:complete